MNLIELSYGMEGHYKFIVKAYHRGLLLEGRELPSCHYYCIGELCCHSHNIQKLSRAEKSKLEIFHHTKYNF